MSTKTASDEGQRPSSGRSCFGDHAGFAQQRARGPCRASREAATCAPTQVKFGPETSVVDTSRPRRRKEVRLGMVNLDRMGSPGEHVCKAPCGLRRAFCSQSARSWLRTSRARVLAWGTPRNARLAWDAQGDVVAARMVGIRQEVKPCRMVPSEKGRGARSTNSCHDVTEKERGCGLPRWCA